MKKLLFWLGGSRFNPKEVEDHYTHDRAESYGLGIFLPVILWVSMSWSISYFLYDLSILTSTMIALSLGFVIFVIESLIIRSPITNDIHGWSMLGIRIMIGLVVAYLGSIGWEVLIFEREVAEQYHQNKIVKLEESLKHSEQALIEARNKLGDAHTYRNNEAGGKGITGKQGYGPVSKALETTVDFRKQDYDSALANYSSIKSEIDKVSKQTAEQMNDDIQHLGVLSRIRTVDQFVKNDDLARMIYWAFTLFLVFVEFFVVINKLSWIRIKTTDDKRQAFRKNIIEDDISRFESMRAGTAKPPVF